MLLCALGGLKVVRGMWLLTESVWPVASSVSRVDSHQGAVEHVILEMFLICRPSLVLCCRAIVLESSLGVTVWRME